MPKVKNSERSDIDGRREYHIKYIEEDGTERIITKHFPHKINITSTTSDLVKNLLLWLTIAFTLMLLFSSFSNKSNNVDSSKLKDSIIAVVKNGAELDVVKNIYKNRKPIDKSIFNLFEKSVLEYSIDMPLSSILEDIKADLYQNYKIPEAKLLTSIDNLIFLHNQKNPFDKLTNQQKDYFENVRQKSGENYPMIQSDINKISDELNGQNLLVEMYLSDSRTSLFISIFSLLFALIVSSYQIYQGRPKKVAENLKALVEGIFSQNESEEKK